MSNVEDPQGLKVVVANGRYDAYGTPGSFRDKYLMKLLYELGGISDTVTPGTYAFNVYEAFGLENATLEPWIES